MKLNPDPRKKSLVHKKEKKRTFPIVAIGASAGGLEAVSQLLKNLPSNTGMAFIFVQHLSPTHKSFLPSILSRVTTMRVQKIDNMELMKPDNVYVIPHNKEIEVTNGHIKLLPRSKKSPAISIDILFSSLALTHKENVIGVILSGNAHDGTIGLKAIKEAGGLTFAQDDSAQVASMPQSAIDSGIVDFILSPKEIALKLATINQDGILKHGVKEKQKAITDDVSGLKAIFEILHKEAGVDFRHYKMSTIKRRMSNRMTQVGVNNTKEYAKLLLDQKTEIDLLYKDLLINVSSFFRDVETFRYLKRSILPKLLRGKSPNETLRIWIPACSRGEEAYSVAMLIMELQEGKKNKIPIQIFATDLSETAIRDARQGKYLQSDIRALSPARVKRFFTKTGNTYNVIEELRKMCVLAPHNILSDPPFFRMDFISCRNLLIYFDIAAQRKVLATIHYALKDEGYLMLGKSETIGNASQLFTQVSTKFRIYARKNNTGVRKIPELSPRFSGVTIHGKNIKSSSLKTTSSAAMELDSSIDAFLLTRHMPACAIINKDLEIIQFRGSTSLYLSHPSGKASLNILKMTRPEFALELRNAISSVIKTKQSVSKSDIEIKIGTEFQTMELEVSPLKIDWEEPLLLIVFKLQGHTQKNIENAKGRINSSTQKDQKIKKLTEELSKARAEIHAVIEAQETAFEELQAANEEIISTNEEFQTLNEELETSKEEIEATNEELIISNQELKTHNELLGESYNYSQTIIETLHEPMLILDSDMNVKSANTSFYKKFLVTKQETEGMPLFKLGKRQWDIPKLHEMLNDVLSKNSHFENFEVTHVFPGIGEKVMLLNANRIIQKTHREKLILLAIEDITELAHYYMKEKELLKKDISIHEADKIKLENAVTHRTRQLKEKNIELEDANKDLTSFTYLSSHDLQEPLRKIQTFISCLVNEEKDYLSKEGKYYLQKTFDAAQRMQTLIEDLLVYSRTKNTERKFERIALKVIVEEVKKDFEEEILQKKAVIKADNICKATMVRFQFHQLLNNLISNSLKFSKPGIPPRIFIECKIVQGDKLKNKNLIAKKAYCHIIFKDNGIGFEPQYNERIFEVFQRLHSKEYQGTGMGLAICKRIAENHNGIITAKGSLNKGVRFDIYIPA